MKTLLQFFIVAMFGIEICSPFFIGYLNHQQRSRKTQQIQQNKYKTEDQKIAVANVQPAKDWTQVDFTESNYSESKTFTVIE